MPMIEPRSFELCNARLILPHRVVHGWLSVLDGKIVEWGEGSKSHGLDCRNDFILPGLIELHTDHLEAHFLPRPKVQWNAVAAVVSYDAQIAAAGITTVFDSLRVGRASESDALAEAVDILAEAIQTATQDDMLRADHHTHLRCEVSAPDVIDVTEAFVAQRPIHLISLMDHTPGQRQFRDLAKMRSFFAQSGFVSDAHFDSYVEERLRLHDRFAAKNRERLVALAKLEGIALASHDDATVEQVQEAIADGVSIAEFPTTIEAAARSHHAGIHVLMGAPNVVRGGSHSGNVAAQDLAVEGILDILSSDYVPSSLLLAAFELPLRAPVFDIARAIRLVTANPAAASGLTDRGEIVIGKRADLVRVAADGAVPIVRTVWREGVRVV
jgi:alpha-D-ribose 1-methylphosphonate 5-triphosphate diphosphatase